MAVDGSGEHGRFTEWLDRDLRRRVAPTDTPEFMASRRMVQRKVHAHRLSSRSARL
jgi:hypothetical protein